MKQCVTKLNRAVCAALVALSLPTLAATPTITGVTAQQRYPWNGKFDISYTASGVDAACQEQDKVASLKVFAVEQTTHVTNMAESAYLSGDTTMADGAHTFVWDMDAQGIFQGLVSTNFEVFVSATVAKPLGGVQLWKNGPYWAECNVGASRPEESGYYFMWGDTNAYVCNANNDGWVSVKDGITLSDGFTESNCPTSGKFNDTLLKEGYLDSTGNLAAAHDAATALLGRPWRTPTFIEIHELIDNCTISWITMNGVSGCLVTGKDKYATKNIFLPAAGYGSGRFLGYHGSYGKYWCATPVSTSSIMAWYLCFYSSDTFKYDCYRHCGLSVRPLRESVQ